MTVSHSGPLSAGTRIGPYEILAWLGAGGMGVVYRARDPRLAREVAVKLVPGARATDAGQVARFEEEARAAGQLNHPNILAVYDVGTHDGAPYIVSELLEGESLRARLQGGKLSPRRAVDYARQAAAGLAAAHDKFIVHRDIKPDNLFVTNDGRIKILDFGIAKLIRPNDDTTGAAASVTETAGIVMGTSGYMSPEQVRGEPVDARSDIFSVGTVLHEMLTGAPAFVRPTTAETMAAILKEDPQEPLPPGTPPALVHIVSRCLEKTREMRYQSARDLAFSLEVLSDTAATVMPAVTPSPRRRRAGLSIVAAVFTLLMATAVWLAWRPAPREAGNPLDNARFSRFTDWPGTEAGAEISPDGRFVVFNADPEGEFDLFLRQIGTDGFTNLTRDTPALSAPGILRIFGFSGDGGEIWYTDPGDSSAPKWRIPLTGGTPRAFLGKGAAAPSWSPDDRRLAYFNNRDGDPFYLADSTGADARPLVVDKPEFFNGKGIHNHNPVWSADGQWIYFAHGPDPTEEMNVWRVRPSGGAPEQLTALHTAANFVAPIDARTLLFVARADDDSGPWLWSLDVETREKRRVTSGLQHYSSVSASRDGRRVVATATNPTTTLWSVPLLDHPAEDRDVHPYPQTGARAFAPRFGHGTLFYLSDRGAGNSLWSLRDGHPFEVWKDAETSLTEPAAVSPDGARIALVVRQGGKRRLSVMMADGTNARTLAPDVEIRSASGQGSADWSPDGMWIVTAGRDAQGPGLFKVAADGSQTVRLAAGDVINPVWSPRGTLIVYGGSVVGGVLPLLGVQPDGTAVKLPDLTVRLGGGYRFLPNGSGLVYLPRAQSLDFWLLDLTTNARRSLTRLSDQGLLRTFDIAPDGQSIVFDRSRENSDIELIDLPRP